MNESQVKPIYPPDTRVMFCFTNNCTSRHECALAHITPATPYFFGCGGNKDRCDDFVKLENA